MTRRNLLDMLAGGVAGSLTRPWTVPPVIPPAPSDDAIRQAVWDYLEFHRALSHFRGEDAECNRLVRNGSYIQQRLARLLNDPTPNAPRLLVVAGQPLLWGWADFDGDGDTLYVQEFEGIRVIGGGQ